MVLGCGAVAMLLGQTMCARPTVRTKMLCAITGKHGITVQNLPLLHHAFLPQPVYQRLELCLQGNRADPTNPFAQSCVSWYLFDSINSLQILATIMKLLAKSK